MHKIAVIIGIKEQDAHVFAFLDDGLELSQGCLEIQSFFACGHGALSKSEHTTKARQGGQSHQRRAPDALLARIIHQGIGNLGPAG